MRKKKPLNYVGKSHTILSLDLGTNCGWALVKDGVATQSGVLELPHEGHPGQRFLNFQNWLHKHRAVDEIFYENVPGFKSSAAAKVHGALLAIVNIFCLVHGIRVTSLKAKSVKKDFTGNGNSDKFAMCAVAHKLGWKGGHPDSDVDHDECDALACAWCILKRRDVEMRMDTCQT